MANLRPGKYYRKEIITGFTTIKSAVLFCNKEHIDYENIIPMFDILGKKPLTFGVIVQYGPFYVREEEKKH